MTPSYQQAVDAWQRGDIAATARLCQRLVALRPTDTAALNLLAGAWFRLGDPAGALQTMQRLVALDPGDAQAHMNLGNLALATGQVDSALAHYERALTINPRSADAHYNRGNALKQVQRLDEARNEFQQALESDARHVAAHIGLANLLRDTGRLELALPHFARAIGLAPALPEAFENLGLTLQLLGRHADAATAFRRAIALRPDRSSLYQQLGASLRRLGQDEPARLALERALALDPGNVEAYSNLGLLHHAAKRVEAAQAVFDAALARGLSTPYFTAERYRCAVQLWDRGRVTEDAGYLRRAVHEGEPQIDPLLLIVASERPEDQLVAARNHSRLHLQWAQAAGLRPLPARPTRAIERERLRVGYLSPDLRDHVVGASMVELLGRHDRARLEVVGISYSGADGSDTRRACIAACDAFHEWGGLSDAELAAGIAALDLDVLLDLAGHSQHRQGMLVHRPARLQVSYLGYPGTSGAPWMDYLIADGWVVPPEEAAHYSEALIRLPECFFPGDTSLPAPTQTPSRQDEGLPEDAFVYACFNNHARVSPALFDSWMRILAAVPDAVLWLQTWHPRSKEAMRRQASQQGIDAGRLIFAKRLEPRTRHLARHPLADLFLDTFPYNMHTTCRDALWAGVPVLTRSGSTFASRVAGSQLRALGLSSLVTTSAQAYEQLAIELGLDPARMQALRTELLAARRTSALFDMGRLAKHLEDAFEAIVTLDRTGQPVQDVTIPARPPG